jgi:hypothetical protein
MRLLDISCCARLACALQANDRAVPVSQRLQALLHHRVNLQYSSSTHQQDGCSSTAVMTAAAQQQHSSSTAAAQQQHSSSTAAAQQQHSSSTAAGSNTQR